MKPVPHDASSMPIPRPPENEIDSELDKVDDFEPKAGPSCQEEDDYECINNKQPHFISQE